MLFIDIEGYALDKLHYLIFLIRYINFISELLTFFLSLH